MRKLLIPRIDINLESIDGYDKIAFQNKTPSKDNGGKFVFLTKTTSNDSTSCITWFHLPKEKRFKSEDEIFLVASSSFDLMSPDLRKLCEKFEKL